jgi:hypothetical protein
MRRADRAVGEDHLASRVGDLDPAGARRAASFPNAAGPDKLVAGMDEQHATAGL